VLGRRLVLLAAATCALLLGACSQDIQGLRTPRSAASQSLGIRWHEGSSSKYRWQINDNFTVNGKPDQHTVGGDCVIYVLSVDNMHVATLQVTLTLDPQYVQANEQARQISMLTVGARGKIAANPGGNFSDLLDLYTVVPLLPPLGSTVGDRWHEQYALPNPLVGDKRDFSVNGQYVRDEGAGLQRLAVIQVHMLASVDDTVPYDVLYGPPPADEPPHMTIHDRGSQVSDITYWYDRAHQILSKSVATHDFTTNREYIDDSKNAVFARASLQGTETVTVTRAES
jgi:hypothetical protein